MAEWSIAPDLKSGGVARHPGVRIPLSPPNFILYLKRDENPGLVSRRRTGNPQDWGAALKRSAINPSLSAKFNKVRGQVGKGVDKDTDGGGAPSLPITRRARRSRAATLLYSGE